MCLDFNLEQFVVGYVIVRCISQSSYFSKLVVIGLTVVFNLIVVLNVHY